MPTVSTEFPEAINLKIRADLMLDLPRFIQAQKWTQAEAALFFGETQPRISNLMNSDINIYLISNEMHQHTGLLHLCIDRFIDSFSSGKYFCHIIL
jgi:predicted XRE-type DNA-binding protein